MTGYEKSPDYGGPEPSWREPPHILMIIAVIAFAIWLVRQVWLYAW